MDFYEIVNESINTHYRKRALLRDEICEAIHDMVEELGGEFKVHDEDFEDDYVGICYDGGNHVEYASTMNSSLESVKSVIGKDFITDKEIATFTVDCEDESDVDAFRLMFDDVTAIFDMVYTRYNYIKEHEDDFTQQTPTVPL